MKAGNSDNSQIEPKSKTSDLEEWKVYLLQCNDESLYCGIAKDVDSRLAAHNSGRGAKYTRGRQPVRLVAKSAFMTKSKALKLEMQVKKLPAQKKIAAVHHAKGLEE